MTFKKDPVKITLLCASLALVSSMAWAALEVIQTEEKALSQYFPDAKIVRQERSLTAEEVAWVNHELGRKPRQKKPVWIRAENSQGDLLGWAFRDDEIGKFELITYLVLLSPELKVLGVELLIYREARGGEIRSARFRRQFVGKALKDPMVVGRDIDAISGATLSSKTLAYGTRKALLLATRWTQPQAQIKVKK